MEVLFWIVMLLAAAVIIWLWRRTTILSTGERVARAKVSEAEQKLKDANPKQLLDLAVSDAERDVQSAAKTLANARAHFNTANRRVDALVDQISALKARAKLAAGHAAQEADEQRKHQLQTAARALASELLAKQEDLESAKLARSSAEQQITQASEMLRNANKRIEKAKDRSRELGVQLDLAKADNSVREAIGGIALGRSVESIDEATEAMERAIDAERAKSEVARDLQPDADYAQVMREIEAQGHTARADELLGELLAEEVSSENKAAGSTS